MSIKGRKSPGGKKKNPLREYFTVRHHGFPPEGAENWLSFAEQATRDTLELLRIAGEHLSLLDLLMVIAKQRADFARQEGHSAAGQANTFGQLRDGAYNLSLDEAAERWQRRIAINRQLRDRQSAASLPELTVTASLTLYDSAHPLFSFIHENLALTKDLVEGCRHVYPLSRGMDDTINGLMKRSLPGIPSSFFASAKYQQTLLVGGADAAEHALTRIYYTDTAAPPFYLIEHPAPLLVQALISDHTEKIFRRTLRQKDTKRYLESLADLNWHCHQLMPFERGSASILLIMTAAMLGFHSIRPRPYGTARMDIDAISLPRTLYIKRFLDGTIGSQ